MPMRATTSMMPSVFSLEEARWMVRLYAELLLAVTRFGHRARPKRVTRAAMVTQLDRKASPDAPR